jgi:hypothetical protein
MAAPARRCPARYAALQKMPGDTGKPVPIIFQTAVTLVRIVPYIV